MSKPTIVLDDPETRAIWNTAKAAAAEVASWPAWKRGEVAAPAATLSSMPLYRHKHPVQAVQFTGSNFNDVADLLARSSQSNHFVVKGKTMTLYVDDIDETVHVQHGDWIIEERGEIKLMRDDRFKEHFAVVEAEPTAVADLANWPPMTFRP